MERESSLREAGSGRIKKQGPHLGLADKTISIGDCDKIDVDNDDTLWTFFFSIWIDQTTYHTAEINATTVSQTAVFGLHVKVHAHFLPQSVV